MADAGEALIDAEDRFQERLAEREHEKARSREQVKDPTRERMRQSLELAKKDLEHQAAFTTHPGRQEQIKSALTDIESRLAAL